MRVSAAAFWSGRLRARPRLFLALVGAALGCASFALADLPRKPAPAQGGPVKITSEPLASFHKTRPELAHFGKLEWRGGLVLSAERADFGGWSGLALGADGKDILAVSDGGSWMKAQIVDDGGRLADLRSATMGPLLAANGKPLRRRHDVDAESVRFAQQAAGRGEVYVAFERKHRIAVASVGEHGISASKRFIELPAEAKRMGRNEGLEGVAVLHAGPLAGSLVAFAEHLPDGKGRHTGWVWVKGKPRAMSLTNPDDFSVTDAVGLADGDLLVLERRFRLLEGVRMRLRHIRADDIRPGAALDGDVLIEADQRQEIDNMEGLAVHEGAAGETVITLISDDNFNRVLQRTLLLRFAWRRDGVAKAE